MKILSFLILLTLPTLASSQGIGNLISSLEVSEVREIVIGVDSVVVMRKSHAKKLAFERIDYWHIQEDRDLKEQLNKVYEERINGYKREISLYQEISSLKDSINKTQEFQKNSYAKTIQTQESQLKKLKGKNTLIVIGLLVAIGVGVSL